MQAEGVKPSPDGAVEVSSGPKVPAAKKQMIPVTGDLTCVECGKTEPRKAWRQKFCSECQSPEAQRARETERKATSRKSSQFSFESTDEAPKTKAKALLEERRIKHPHVLRVVMKALETAATKNHMPVNRFLFEAGFQIAKKSHDEGETQPIEKIAAEPVTGGLLTRAELQALWDSCVSPYERTTFDEFLEIRRRCKTNCYYLGKEVLQKDFEQIHEEWSQWLPRFNPDTLPSNYTQKQVHEWLKSQCDEQGGIREFLMIASRASFNSSFSHIWIVTAILCCPDIRVLLVSETKPLSKDFIGVIRGFFEAEEGFESRFQRYFAEYTIPKGDGEQLSLECPMAHLRLAQSTTNCTSMDSAQAGKRADIIVFDDPISNLSCENETQINKSVAKRDALVKLGEVGARIVLTIGTPWAENDLYAQLIDRNENAEEPFMLHRVDPAFRVVAHAQRKLTVNVLASLVPEDIESYLFSRFTWKTLRPEMASAKFFLSQNLCIFPKNSDENLRVTFSQEDLDAHTCAKSFFGTMFGAQTVMTMDRAYSTSIFADFSCLTVGKIGQVRTGPAAQPRTAVVVWDVRMERWKQSEIVKNVADMFEIHRPTVFLAEMDKGWQDLEVEIRKLAMFRSVPVPRIKWVPTQTGAKTPLQKAKRIKKLEGPLAFGNLWFADAEWNDAVFAQFTKMDGGIFTESNSHRKLDAPDCIGLLYEHFGPKWSKNRKKFQTPRSNRRPRRSFSVSADSTCTAGCSALLTCRSLRQQMR